MSKKIINTTEAPAAIGPYSQAVRAGDMVYISGQIPLDPESMQVVSGDFADQAEQVFKNLKAVAKAAGGSLQDAVKLSVFLTDLNDFVKLNDIMTAHIPEPFPARAAVQVSRLPKDVNVEIEAILYLPN